MNTHEPMTEVEQAAYTVVRQAGESRLWRDVMAQAEQGAIKAALDMCAGIQTDAATFLGMSRNTLRERLVRYDLRDYGGAA